MRVLILGGDGYLGWPTAMQLSALGHEVTVVDNYLRRNICREMDVRPLFEVPSLDERAAIWKEKSGKDVKVYIGDLMDWSFTAEVFEKTRPEAVIHYAEQPSAPYSMASRRAATLTLKNNLEATANAIFAVREFARDAHIVKIGTMGEYGTPNIDIEEGWIDIEHKGRSQKFLYPRQASSLYHTTKIMDTDMLWFYVRMWGLKVTDLMQGPVYGLITDESQDDERLFPFFNYDELFGTVLNRFIVQAVVGYPLTVYGSGGQTRGYLNIKDTLNCVRLSLENPPEKPDLRIFNQFTETFSVNELAEKVQRAGKTLGLDVEVKSVPNPRKEAEEHYYNPAHTGLLDLGLEPKFLTDDVMAKMMEVVMKHKHNIYRDSIFRGVKWD
ncbi:NAD-dependent epimerase/dehydratase [Desulfatibacillum aliphaticivorans]|uniref:NAD-dependent epimerase/dehydratase n=1 Tax=Desulfatibacillum aliphaticivorans TaxID=218208 RepID=B8FAQ8_DESAL|nr:NAD-dependent epimerase/dehydratase family protein [Desulfatibacillum aliphaticivorans]ACL03354.1 NAD-dependent epimerase/dehydratase [Desulfatibacillum aliphaticivorans]